MGWLNYCIKDPINGGKANGEYKQKYPQYAHGNKIVLIQNSRPRETGPRPAHFSIDMSEGGLIYQHIEGTGQLSLGPGYRLGWDSDDGSRSDNRSYGLVVQVALCNMPKSYSQDDYKTWWDFYKWHQITWFLYKLCTNFAVPKKYPHEWSTKYGENPIYLGEDGFLKAAGILGQGHGPHTFGRNPGFIGNRWWLEDAMKDTSITGGNAPQGYDGISVFYAADQANETDHYKDPNNPNSDVNDDDQEDQGVPYVEDVDMRDKPFKFNPPLHSYSWPVRRDFASEIPRMVNAPGEMAAERAGAAEAFSSKETASLESLRLGRIIQHEWAAGAAALNEFRYGFRFLYNPTQITISASRNTSIILDPRSTMNAVISGINQNFQTVSFQLFLNRFPDVVGPKRETSYYQATAGLNEDDLNGIRTYGTHWDLEYLYRVCNGIFDLEDRGKTADIGVIVPSNARLLLGNENWFGFVESIRWEDTHFSEAMVPVLTTVDIVFRRHVDISPDSYDEWVENLGQLYGGAGGDDDSDGGSPGDSEPEQANTGLVLDGDTVWELAREAGFGIRDATIATKIAWGESGWKPSAYNGKGCDMSYGLWQINMVEGRQTCNNLGADRRKAWGIKNDDLFDPKVNAAAAYSVFRTAGNSFNPWTVYTEGIWRNAPYNPPT